MRILYLAHRIPYPPNKGDKIRSYHHLRHLAQRHDVHLVAFVDDPADLAGRDALRELCREVVLVPLDRRRALARGVLSLACGRSVSEGYFAGPAMRDAVSAVAAGRAFDAAWAFSSTMAQYLPLVNARLRVADFVDMDSDKWRQLGDLGSAPGRWLYRIEGNRVARMEARASTHADSVLFVSEAEARLFRRLRPNGCAVAVVPNGVDRDYFRPAGVATGSHPPTILFTGALDYAPNIDAVLWFTREVIPLMRRELPEARLLAVGHRPARALLRATDEMGGMLEVEGSVPDVRPYFRCAYAYAAPLRLGRGVQNKVLEAMAMGLPVVASPLATAGLDAVPDTHVLIGQTADEFARAALTLWSKPSRRQQLTEAALELIHEYYDWNKNLQRLDLCLTGEARRMSEASWMACSV